MQSASDAPAHHSFRYFPPQPCREIIKHAAQDNTLLFLSLLPLELHCVIDHFVRSLAWPASGVMRRLPLPDAVSAFDSAEQTVSAEGDLVIVLIPPPHDCKVSPVSLCACVPTGVSVRAHV